MPTIKRAEESARTRLRSRPGTTDARAPFREAIAGLEGDAMLEIRPEGEETMRRLKVNVARASGELRTEVAYGETVDGALLVWRRTESSRRGRRRTAES